MKKEILKNKKDHYFISNIKKCLKSIGKTFIGIALTLLLANTIHSAFVPKLNNTETNNAFIVHPRY